MVFALFFHLKKVWLAEAVFDNIDVITYGAFFYINDTIFGDNQFFKKKQYNILRARYTDEAFISVMSGYKNIFFLNFLFEYYDQ